MKKKSHKEKRAKEKPKIKKCPPAYADGYGYNYSTLTHGKGIALWLNGYGQSTVKPILLR